MVVAEDDEVLLINSEGIIIRIKADDVSILGRATRCQNYEGRRRSKDRGDGQGYP